MRTRLSSAKQWQFYEAQTNVAKQRASDRLSAIQQIEALVDTGMTKSGAVNAVATVNEVSVATLWSWLSMIADVSPHDRLAYLVPMYRGGGRRFPIDDAIFNAIAADYLRAERPSWADCIRRLEGSAKLDGTVLPHSRTLWRRLCREYGKPKIAMLRGQPLPNWLRARLPANDR